MLNINEIDFLVDTECKNLVNEEVPLIERFKILDNSSVYEISSFENFTFLCFKSKISAVLAYNRLVNLPETRLLWDFTLEEYVIAIQDKWLEEIRKQEHMKMPHFKASKTQAWNKWIDKGKKLNSNE